MAPHGDKHAGTLIGDGRMYVFTTRADTIMGVTFCAVAAEHPLAVACGRKPIRRSPTFIDECRRGSVIEADLATMEKKGMPRDLFVTHPITGEKIEVWVGNYVLMTYGDGAVMGVPAHDERDFEFAKKYGLPIKQVIAVPERGILDRRVAAVVRRQGARSLRVLGEVRRPEPYAEAVDAVAADLAAKGLGEKKITFRLRDWGVSRQRYWGTPIPIIHCDACGAVPVPERDLPVVLPEDCIPDGSGNPLNKRPDFLNVACPQVRQARAARDGHAGHLRRLVLVLHALHVPGADRWSTPATTTGCRWTSTSAASSTRSCILLYARFWTKAMRDLGLVKIDEPFTRLFTQGMLLNHIYFRRNAKGGKDYHSPDDVTPVTDALGHITGGRLADGSDGRVRRRGQDGQDRTERRRTAGPDRQIRRRHRAAVCDVCRIARRFRDLVRRGRVEGAHRFLKRLWTFVQTHSRCRAQCGRPLRLSAMRMTVRREGRAPRSCTSR